MRELQNIIQAFGKLERDAPTAALATIVDVSGSTYRRAGARMLVTQYGQSVGTISGGCLERDVVLHARRAMEYGQSHVARYDLSFDEDDESGFVMGCNGTVDVLVEPISGADPAMRFLSRCTANRTPGVLATLFAVDGEVGARSGSRLMLVDGSAPEPVAMKDAELEYALEHDAHKVLKAKRSMTRVYDLRAGRVAAFIEFIKPAQSLVIFGAGHDAMPLVRMAKDLGWHVTVVDSKPGYATVERFPSADVRIKTRPADAITQLSFEGDNTAAVVMNHNYVDDREALLHLLSAPVGYIGVLGPRKRTQRLLDDLRTGTTAIPSSAASRIYGPVGLDIGAETPTEVALAIIAEIKAFTEGRQGGPARERKGPLHARREAEAEQTCLSPTQVDTLVCALASV